MYKDFQEQYAQLYQDGEKEYWKNEHWTAVEAQQAANQWNDRFFRNKCCSLSAWQSFAVTNIVTNDWPLVRRLRHGDEEMQTFKSHVHAKGHAYRKDFARRLFES